MQYTENYNLYKPVYGESANVADLNHNADEIDGLIHENRTMIAPAFDTAQAYVTDDPVEYQGKLYVFTADKAAGAWDSSKVRQTTAAEIGGGGGASALADLDDVNITTPTDGQILVYDDTDDEWKNADIPDPSVTAEATGNPITLTDAADAPMVECKATITPKQDLHGQDKPWPPGAGKNKLNPAIIEDGYSLRATNGLPYEYSGRCATTTPIDVTNLNTVTLSYTSTVTRTWGIYSKLSNNTLVERSLFNGSGVVIDVSDADQLYIAWYSNDGDVLVSNLSNIQLESGSTATSYEPYSNICPITGMDEVGIEVRGKNLWDETWEVGNISSTTGNNATDSTRFRTQGYIDIIPNTAYYLVAPNDLGLRFYDASKNFFGSAAGTANSPFTTPNNAYFMRFVNVSSNVYANNICISYGSSPTPYEPYTSTTHTIQLGNTYYGGTVDVVRGSKTVTTGYASYNGSENWELVPSYNNNYRLKVYLSFAKKDGYGIDVLCNKYEYKTVGSSTRPNGAISLYQSGSSYYIVIRDDRFNNDVNAFMASLYSENLEITYKRITPSITPLAPTAIRSLLGSNYISTDAKTLTLTYLTSRTQPIIDATNTAIVEHGKKIESIITENLEPRMVASRNYTIGELIISGDKAYRATANIASGATLTVNTNVVATTIEEEIGRSGHVYSTAEQVVGTWVDGSTLYEKTYTVSSVSGPQSYVLEADINNFEIIDFSGVFLDDALRSIPSYSSPTTPVVVYKYNNNLYIQNSLEHAIYNVAVTIRYYKSSS